MEKLQEFFISTENARQSLIASCEGITIEQSHYKTAPDSWSIAEIVEHLVWAENGGINGMWLAIEGIKTNQPVWSGDPIHHGRSIEQVIEVTWKLKEKVPAGAGPQWGGPIGYWLSRLRTGGDLLKDLMREVGTMDPALIINPHPISGPLNVYQRFEFLRFHMERHQLQIENIKKSTGFPSR